MSLREQLSTLSRIEKKGDKACNFMLCITFIALTILFAFVRYYGIEQPELDTPAPVMPSISILTPLVTALGCMYLFTLIRLCLRSGYQHPVLEAPLVRFFNNRTRILPAWVFYTASSLSPILFVYILYYTLFAFPFMQLSLQDMNLFTLKPLPHAMRVGDISVILTGVTLGLTTLILAARPATISPVYSKSYSTFLVHLAVITPLLILSPASGMDYTTLLAAAGVAANPSENEEMLTYLTLGIVIALTLLTMVKIIKRHWGTPAATPGIINDFRQVCQHAVAAAGVIYLAHFASLHSMAKPVSSLHGEINVTIEGTTLRINQDMFLPLDGITEADQVTEELVEAALGINPINQNTYLGDILSADYSGNQEEAIRLAAHIALMQGKNLDLRKSALTDALKNNRHYLSTYSSLSLAVLYADWFPLSHQQRTLESIVAGRYQEAVNYYLKDALNNTDTRYTTIPRLDDNGNYSKEMYTGSTGGIKLPDMIVALVRNNLVTFDANAINDKTRRERFNDKLESDRSGDPFTEAQIQQWVTLFKLPPLPDKEPHRNISEKEQCAAAAICDAFNPTMTWKDAQAVRG